MALQAFPPLSPDLGPHTLTRQVAIQTLPEGLSYMEPSSSTALPDGLGLSGFCPVTLQRGHGGLMRRAQPGLGFLR